MAWRHAMMGGVPVDLLLALAATYERVGETVAALDDADFERPTRTAEWTIAELLFHQSLDAVRALTALASTTDAATDVDAVSYWRPFRPGEGDGGAAHARFVQRSAAAYSAPAGLVAWWRTVSVAAVRAARSADAGARVETQGHVLSVPDLVSTLLVEATVHHLDLTVDLPAAPAPPVAGLVETRRVLEALNDAPLPAAWSDTEAALKATGRVSLTDADRIELGDRAGGIPLLG